MINKKGFTILELLVALVISGFILVGMTRILNYAMLLLDRGTDFSLVDRTAGILLNQLDKDISAAYIPYFYNYGRDGKEEKEALKLEVIKNFFIGEIRENFEQKVQKKKRELLKNINFITTNPVQIYAQKKIHFARVKYELVLNKEKSKGDLNNYDLFRYETANLENYKFEDSDNTFRKNKAREKIWKHEVANNIKGIFVEYGKKYLDDKDKKEKTNYTYEWREKDNLPDKVKIFLVFWNSAQTMEFNFEILIPILSEEKKVEKKKIEELNPKGPAAGKP
ncbi:prepilin-type N-terminal cleavage/methylation domain-containing protein [Candidatus Babeliales bacterium]|nr:prepilin-type N-terminal cleavage/methylation domain-containing protein [Candidatus Babeliales bacterium]